MFLIITGNVPFYCPPNYPLPPLDINPASKHNFNYDCEHKNNILLDTEFLNLLRKLLVMHLNGIPQHNTLCTATEAVH